MEINGIAHIALNVSQLSVSKKFYDNIVESYSEEEKKKYLFYRSEWYRRAKQFDYGKAPLAVTCELVSTCNLG